MSIVFEYIDRLEAAINEGRCSDDLILDTVATFSDIEGIKKGLDRYRARVIAVGSSVKYDNLGDARRLKDKLRRYAEGHGMKRNGSGEGNDAGKSAPPELLALRDDAKRLQMYASEDSIGSGEFAAWQARVSRLFDRYPHLAPGFKNRIESISFATEYYGTDGIAPPRAVEDFRQGMNVAIACLDAMIEDYGNESCRSAIAPSDSGSDERNDKVFIVHGRDDSARLEVKALLDGQGLEPIVLFEQANGGMTIIEKLEANSDVRAAVFLLTADDEGRLGGDVDFHPRARQNVVFEAGMFIGKLGRGHVAFVVDPGIELPSDIAGIGYIAREGGWKLELLKELKGMGFDVDANKLLG